MLRFVSVGPAAVPGGTFKTHGILYDDTYDRSLYPPGDKNCSGPSGYQVRGLSQISDMIAAPPHQHRDVSLGVAKPR